MDFGNRQRLKNFVLLHNKTTHCYRPSCYRPVCGCCSSQSLVLVTQWECDFLLVSLYVSYYSDLAFIYCFSPSPSWQSSLHKGSVERIIPSSVPQFVFRIFPVFKLKESHLFYIVSISRYMDMSSPPECNR